VDYSHYNDGSVQLAVDLVNTFDPTDGSDRLTDADELQVFLDYFEDEFSNQIWWEGEPSEPDVSAIRDLRDRLKAVWEIGSISKAVAILNELLKTSARPRISAHNGRDPHFHFDPGVEGQLVEWLSAATAMALGTVLVSYGYDRFGICESATCDDVYIDTSKNRSRRHCSTICTTRENVAAHRRRAKEG
jgi:predicted RNA-binding Zn ribbon-like protein